MLETQVQFLSWEDHLRKKMAIYSSILAWRIPKTEDPGRLQSMWLPRSRHNWVAEQQQTDLPLTDFRVSLWRLLPWKPNKTITYFRKAISATDDFSFLKVKDFQLMSLPYMLSNSFFPSFLYLGISLFLFRKSFSQLAREILHDIFPWTGNPEEKLVLVGLSCLSIFFFFNWRY